MKLTAVAILKKQSGDADPILLGLAADLSNFGFFQRGSVKEMLIFVARTVAKRFETEELAATLHIEAGDYCNAICFEGEDSQDLRSSQVLEMNTTGCRTQPGQRQTVKNEEYYCHAHNRDGLVGIAFADGEYPARAGFGIVNKILDEFSDTTGNKWRTISEDSTDALPILEPALQKYQVHPHTSRSGMCLKAKHQCSAWILLPLMIVGPQDMRSKTPSLQWRFQMSPIRKDASVYMSSLED